MELVWSLNPRVFLNTRTKLVLLSLRNNDLGGNEDNERNICRFLPDGTLQGTHPQSNTPDIRLMTISSQCFLICIIVALSNFQYGFDTAVSINIKLLGKITAEQSSFRSSTAFKPPKGFFAYLEWNQSRGSSPSRCVRCGLRQILVLTGIYRPCFNN